MTTPQEIKVGDGATAFGYSDRRAYTIVEVKAGGRVLVVQRDKAILLNGVGSGEPDALTFSPGGFHGHTAGRQRYRYEAQPNAQRVSYSLRKNGRYVAVGSPAKNGEELKPGERSEFYDYNF